MTDDAHLSESYFLSYSRADERLALKFAEDLRSGGIAMWVDQIEIRPSEHWDRAIERAVRDCRGLVVILSPRSTSSENVADEISFAIDHGKSVLPVVIERCPLPLRITRMQVVDATANYDRAVQQCIDVLTGKSPKDAAAPTRQTALNALTNQEVIASAKARLTQILGPIATLLVDKEAARANSEGELYTLLAERIESENDRKKFLELAGDTSAKVSPPFNSTRPAQESIPAEEVDRLSAILTHYLGPIAAVVTRRESRTTVSAAELKQRLASRIPHERERAEFLRRAEMS